MSRIKIAVVGATGRMGRMIIESALKDSSVELVAAIDLPGSPLVGKPAGELVGMSCNVPVTDDVEAGIAKSDCLIDFTRPEGTLGHLAICRRLKVAMVVGTTGLDDEAKKKVAEAAQDIPLVFAPNMSVGVNVVFKLLDMAAARERRVRMLPPSSPASSSSFVTIAATESMTTVTCLALPFWSTNSHTVLTMPSPSSAVIGCLNNQC